MESQQPQMFGTYKVIRPIGKGGFAQVYLVEDNLGRPWALKQIHQDLIKQDPGFRERFEREAHIQAGLEHTHIAGVHTFDAEEGYLVIKYIDGRTLRDLLDDDYPRGMDPPAVLEILQPIEEALTYIHKDAGLAHLDLKPGNILIQETHTLLGRTKRHIVLADFGLARVIDHEGKANGGASLYGGTPPYWAPEQVDPAKGTPGMRSDIYSLGLVIGVMLTGRKAQEVLDILRGTSNTLPPTLSPEVKQVLQRATDEKPENRYASVRGLVNDFTGAVEEARTRTVSSTIPAPWPTSRTYPRNPPNQSPWGKALGLVGAIRLKKIVAIVAMVVLLSLVAGILVWNLPATHLTQLRGLDLTKYCTSLNYQTVIADDSFCVATINLDTACNWQYETTGLHFHLTNPNNPESGSCYGSQGNAVGGISGMDDYCKDPRQNYLGIPVATTVGNTWVCEQKIDATLACIWRFSRTDVQARKNEQGLWICYSLFPSIS